MGRPPRLAVGNIVYHVLNRANGRLKIFEQDKDYQAFEKILGEAKKKYPMRILAYCLMPNHWHLVLFPKYDGDLSNFMRWATLTHTQRWHAFHKSTGYGHLYQGRFKSFPVQEDKHFLQVCRYVERNPLRAGLAKKAQDWQWSSLWTREYGNSNQQDLLSPWPTEPDQDYIAWVNAPQPKEEVALVRVSVSRGRPFGDEDWTHHTSTQLGLESTFRNRGRPW